MVTVIDERDIALGRGSTSLVMEGQLKFNGATKKVAIKRRYFGGDHSSKELLQQYAERTAREVKVLQAISHPNLMDFLGVAVDIPRGGHQQLLIISTICEEQHLKIYLTRNPGAPRMPLTLDIALGIQYLHDRSIVHGQLKPRNIAIKRQNDGVRAVIMDFSFARITSDQTFGQWRPGVHRYTPHEIIPSNSSLDTLVTPASDVYAFAFVALKLISGTTAFEGQGHYVILARLLKGDRPNKSDHLRQEMTNDIWELLTRCWSQSPTTRPTASDIVTCVQNWVN